MNKLDQIIHDVTNEQVPQNRIDEAARRVRQTLFSRASGAPERIRSCADYQALIPAYLSRTLSAGRSLLLQDHTRECVACRHALDEARAGKIRTLVRPQTPPTHNISKVWAIAAMAILTLGLGALLVTEIMPGAGGKATVQTVSGILYAVSDTGSTPIFSGREIPEGQHIRTAKDSKAYVRLGDGSIVEVNERSELWFNRALRGTNIRLDRGGIIVQAAKQRSGTLNVLTADCTVSVKGTIFAVDRGVKGSRVSVVEGSVKVDQGSQSAMLKPGDQVTTDSSIARTSAAEAVSWSRDSARYLALLGEFSVIKKGLDQMPSAGLRHDSKLLPFVPRDAVLYAAIPNLGPTLAEAERLFNERLQQSEVLRSWWEEQKEGPKVQEMVHKLRAFSDYIGDEIVLTISGDWEGRYTAPLVLAEVKKPGLDAFLNNEIRQFALKGEKHLPQVVRLDAPSGSGPQARRYRGDVRAALAKSDNMYFGVRDNVFAIGWNQEQMDQLAARMSATPSPVRENSFLARVQKAYADGTQYLLCVNMEHIAENSVNKGRRDDEPKVKTGFEAMRYLTVERKEVDGRIENQATLAFAGHRSGMAGWLSEPAPMGSLDFISPNATFVVSMVLKSPQWMLNDLFRTLASGDPKFQDQLDRFHSETGMRLSPTLGEPLGGEITFAVDGPLLPLPSWKLAVEVYSPERLQANIEQAIEIFNRNSQCANCKIALAKQVVDGRTFYTLSTEKIAYEIYYTYVDGYLVAAPNQTLLTRAIQNRAVGNVLARSEAFRAQLPRDGRLNFSALVYHNIGTALSPLAEQIGSMGSTPAQRESIQALIANSKPGLIYAYGDSDSISIATAGSFFGFDIDTFALPSLIGRGMTLGKGVIK
jgi:hypothetical protein